MEKATKLYIDKQAYGIVKLKLEGELHDQTTLREKLTGMWNNQPLNFEYTSYPELEAQYEIAVEEQKEEPKVVKREKQIAENNQKLGSKAEMVETTASKI